MEHWYYSPWQYELREFVEEEALDPTGGKTSFIPRVYRLPVLAGLAFLAYAPLVQPGPPAKTPDPFTLQLYQLGGGMIV